MGYGYPPQYGQGYGGSAAYGPPPPNHLVWAILSTIFCCWVTGIVAIIFAAQVDSKYNSGDYYGAVDASNKARLWSIISAVSILVIIVIYLLVAFVGVALVGTGSSVNAGS